MTHILHLGHQPTDISGVNGRISTNAAGFDADLDVNGIIYTGFNTYSSRFSLAVPEPAGDLWLGFRYLTPHADAQVINVAGASFPEFLDASQTLMAQIKPVTSTNSYHAIAHGDASVQGSSSYIAPNGQAQWIDVRVVVGAQITLEFHVDGVLQSAATAANTGARGKPRIVTFANTGLHGLATNRTWYYAHIAVLDGVSTIGRRFVRRTPNTVATYAQMAGSVDALRDGNIATRVASTVAGQRMSFSLSGPTGPAAVSAIAGVHLNQIAQAGVTGPDALAGFLRMGGVNHDSSPVSVPVLAPKPVWSSWALDPADGSPWSTLTLPTEVGIVSA